MPALASLALAWQAGVSAAQSRLVYRLTPMIVELSKIYSVGAPELTEDLIAAGKLGLAIAVPRWRADGGASVRTWCRVEAVHQMKKVRSQYERYRSRASDYDEIYPAESCEQDGVLDRERKLIRIWEIACSSARIKSRHLQVLRMTYLEGKSLVEIAAELKIPKHTVRSRLTAALAVIKEEIRA